MPCDLWFMNCPGVAQGNNRNLSQVQQHVRHGRYREKRLVWQDDPLQFWSVSLYVTVSNRSSHPGSARTKHLLLTCLQLNIPQVSVQHKFSQVYQLADKSPGRKVPDVFHVRLLSDLFLIIIIINPLTARVVGAPQMILQPVFSIFPCSPLPSGTCRTPGLSIPWCCLHKYLSPLCFRLICATVPSALEGCLVLCPDLPVVLLSFQWVLIRVMSALVLF